MMTLSRVYNRYHWQSCVYFTHTGCGWPKRSLLVGSGEGRELLTAFPIRSCLFLSRNHGFDRCTPGSRLTGENYGWLVFHRGDVDSSIRASATFFSEATLRTTFSNISPPLPPPEVENHHWKNRGHTHRNLTIRTIQRFGSVYMNLLGIKM